MKSTRYVFLRKIDKHNKFNKLCIFMHQSHRATFALLLYKRLTLDSLGAPVPVTVEGDPALVAVLDQWLQQP